MDTYSFEVKNQNSVKMLKDSKILKAQRIKKRGYKTLGTSVTNSPMSPPSPVISPTLGGFSLSVKPVYFLTVTCLVLLLLFLKTIDFKLAHTHTHTHTAANQFTAAGSGTINNLYCYSFDHCYAKTN